MLARFFWKNNLQVGIHWKSKEVLHTPRGQGGLGIRNISCFNKALLMKKVWRINQHPQLLLAKVFQSQHQQKSWSRTSQHNMSLGRRGLLKVSQSLQGLCGWKMGNGSSIRATSQAWVNGKIPTCRDGITLREAASTTVADLILPNNQGWNYRLIHKIFTPNDARSIKCIELPSRPNESDKIYWPLTQSGNYSTKSGYGLMLQH